MAFKYFCILGRIRDKVLNQMMADYAKETDLRNDVINALPKHYISTLNSHRQKFIGKLPDSRDQYDPDYMLRSFQNV